MEKLLVNSNIYFKITQAMLTPNILCPRRDLQSKFDIRQVY